MHVVRIAVTEEGADVEPAAWASLAAEIVEQSDVVFDGPYVASDSRSALLGIPGSDDEQAALDRTFALSDSLRNRTVDRFPIGITVYQPSESASPPAACPVCDQVGRHDLSKHSRSEQFDTGLTEITLT